MTTDPTRQNTPAVRRLLVPFVVLAGLGAIQLYLFPADTDRLFAWTLGPEPSATFMGAGFAAGVVLTVLSYRRQPWAVTRTATLAVFVFAAVMTLATFLHLDRMHFSAEPATARIAAWLWVIVYVVVAPLLAILILVQRRQPGVDPPRITQLPVVLRRLLFAQGGVMLVVGVALFVAPAAMEKVWPWEITPLAARALAAWIIAIGWAGLQVAWENDTVRVRPAAVTYALLGVLWLLAAVRGASFIRWERPSTWLYVAFVTGAAAIGVWGWALGRPHHATEHGG